MGITWVQGRDSLGYNWLHASEEGSTRMQPIYWKDGDPAERFRYLAEQAQSTLQSEQDQLRRLSYQVEVHKLQVLAFQAISEVLATGQAITITIEPLEPAILPQKPEGA